jgi:hypothetical protein
MFQSKQQQYASGQQAEAARTPRKKKPRGPQMNMASPFGRTTDGTPITQSTVNAQQPYTGSQLRAYTQPRTAVTAQYGVGGGDRTRQAFAQAAGMQRSNVAQKSYEDLSRAYRAQQEQTRAADIESMRADQVRRYSMDEDYVNKRRTQEIERVERIKDLRNQLRNTRLNTQTQLGENLTGLLLSGLMPVAGAYAQDQYENGNMGRAMGGLFGGLFG